MQDKFGAHIIHKQLIRNTSSVSGGSLVERRGCFVESSSHLYPQDTKHNEESTADQNDVSYWSEGCDEGLDHKLQPRGSANHPATHTHTHAHTHTHTRTHAHTHTHINIQYMAEFPAWLW